MQSTSNTNFEKYHKSVEWAHVFYGLMLNTILIFGIVFFYINFDYSLTKTLALFGGMYLLSSVFVFFVPKLAQIIPSKYLIIFSMILYFLSFYELYLFEINQNSTYVIAYALTYALARSIYMTLFQIYLCRSASSKGLGGDLGKFFAIISLAGVAHPWVAGYMSESFDTLGLVVLGGIFAIVPIIIYLKIPSITFTSTLSIKQIFVDKSEGKVLNSEFWNGFHQPQKFLWSIILFLFLNEQFQLMGTFIAVLSLVTSVALVILGKFLDKTNRKKIFDDFKGMNALEHLFKAIASGTFLYWFADLFGRINSRLFSLVEDTYYFSWITRKNQKDLEDERILLGQSIFDFTIGAVLGIYALVIMLTSEEVGHVYAFVLTGIILLIPFFINIIKDRQFKAQTNE